MSRPAKFSADDLLDAAARAVLDHGPQVSVADVGRAAGAPVGSIYHRFRSREELLASLWVRSIRHFHVGFLAALRLPDPQAAIEAAARHVPAHCRAHPAEARAMTLFSRQHLLQGGPESIRAAVEHVNDGIDGATGDLCARRYGSVSPELQEILVIATRLSPYGLVRAFIGADVPALLDDAAAVSATAIATLGDAGSVRS